MASAQWYGRLEVPGHIYSGGVGEHQVSCMDSPGDRRTASRVALRKVPCLLDVVDID
jgi:hypothetical protein